MLKQAAEQAAEQPPAQEVANLGAPPTAVEGAAMAREGQVPTEEVEATPEEQAEYERAVGALGKIMYEDDGTADAIIDQLREEDPVGSMVKSSMLIVRQLDDQLDLDEAVIAELLIETTSRVIDLYENKFETELEPADAEKVLMAAWEGLLEVYDIEKDEYRQFIAGMSEDDIKGMEQTYNQKLQGES